MTRPALPAISAGNTTLGIVFMIGFSVLAPVMDTAAKLIGDGLAVGQVAATRFVFQAAILLPIAWAAGWLHRPRRGEIRLHLARALLLLMATSLFFFSLRYMPVAEAISIFFVEPFILTLLGAWLLSEPIGPRRYVACAIGFAGALLIIRPTFHDVGVVAFLPLGTACLFALYMILTRRMATTMNPITLQAYTGLAALVIAMPILTVMDGSGVAELDPSWPTQREILLLCTVGLVATLSHVCISFALSFAPASTIAPLQYLEIVSATLLGFWIFGELPDAITWLGITLIVGSGLFVFLRERHLERRPPPPP
ncbi:DMT family transporter [Roseovarius sp. SCSIO 43702]|uniref:DMT family transporter n=1 Tax=Roseovarius sp. SCSIO 43702 TaxID=2823043 RepID=UPI001C72B745|nr:DMT family transporter [Roseovarius sp. SCSIO 43702]QYX55723.1 DMT family transporter [Roseovarius sp. SCSIO 43702]